MMMAMIVLTAVVRVTIVFFYGDDEDCGGYNDDGDHAGIPVPGHRRSPPESDGRPSTEHGRRPTKGQVRIYQACDRTETSSPRFQIYPPLPHDELVLSTGLPTRQCVTGEQLHRTITKCMNREMRVRYGTRSKHGGGSILSCRGSP